MQRRSRTGAIAGAGVACALASLLAQPAPRPERSEPCRVERTTYHGWEAVRLANAWVTLMVVPRIGGRLMQVTFGGHDYLFVNDELKGQYYTPPMSAAQKRWFNYGGDKIWPMPEGSNDEQHWPGAAGAVLDSGGYTWDRLTDGAACAVRLTGPHDPFIGQQYIRDIGIEADSPVISFHAVMKNISGYPQTWSEQSVTQYATADRTTPGRANPDFWGFTPANPKSVFPDGYKVRAAGAPTAGYVVRDGLFAVHASEAAGEVWIDSPGEWLAVVDGSTQYAMVERFRYRRGEEYPGDTTVIFYTTAPPQPPRTPLFYIEAEINSPLVRLEPGESYALDTQWFPTRMGRDLKTVTYAGAIGEPLTATATPDGLRLEGTFGVFFAGKLEARFYDRRGLSVGTAELDTVSPLELVTLRQTVKPPADAARVSLHLMDGRGVDRGPLGEASV